jgi:hypothetical protein
VVLKTKLWSTDEAWELVPNEGVNQVGDRFLTVNFDWETNDMQLVPPDFKGQEILPFKKGNLLVKN